MEYYKVYSDEFYHSGVKGMKWGKRLYQHKDGSLTPLGRARLAARRREQRKNLEKARAAKVNKKKAEVEKQNAEVERKKALASGKLSVKDMTDDELKQRIDRLNLEQRYKELSPKEVSKGKTFVSGMLEQSAKNIGTQLTTYAMGAAVNAIAKKAGADGNIVNPKKGQKDK